MKKSRPRPIPSGKQKKRRGEELLVPGHVSNLVEASKCIADANAEPLGRYLAADLATILNLLADRFDPPEAPGGAQHSRHEPLSVPDAGSGQIQTSDHETEEWVSDTADVEYCISAGFMVPVAWFLRDLSVLARQLGRAIGPNGDPEGMELRFVRRRRGKPTDPMEKMFRETRIQNAVLGAPADQKRESVIQEVMGRTGRSRSTIFKTLSKGESGKRKSHKIRNK